jgi:hypothetical protein
MNNEMGREEKYLKVLRELTKVSFMDLELKVINSIIDLRIPSDFPIETEDDFTEMFQSLGEVAYAVYVELKKDEQ